MSVQNRKERFQACFRRMRERLRSAPADGQRRVSLLLAVGLAGLLLLGVSEWLPAQSEEPAADTAAAASQQDYAQALESRLQALISQLDGAGKTEVMVTLAAGEESVYAADTTQNADGSGTETHVLLGSGGAQGLVETVYTPRVLGVAVVCAGGANPAVQSRITELVAAVTDVGTNHITVAAMAVK